MNDIRMAESERRVGVPPDDDTPRPMVPGRNSYLVSPRFPGCMTLTTSSGERRNRLSDGHEAAAAREADQVADAGGTHAVH